MFLHGEPVEVFRAGVLVGTVLCGIDRADSTLYMPPATDVLVGDKFAFDGGLRRTERAPMPWHSPFTGKDFGIVVKVADETPFLPDAGRLLRSTGTTFNAELNAEVPNEPELIWEGPCAVEPASAVGADQEIAEQLVAVMPYEVSVPLSVIDIQVGDVFQITASDDLELVARPLRVTRFQGSTTEPVRKLTAVDKQD
jgi:hypothetical protein